MSGIDPGTFCCQSVARPLSYEPAFSLIHRGQYHNSDWQRFSGNSSGVRSFTSPFTCEPFHWKCWGLNLGPSACQRLSPDLSICCTISEMGWLELFIVVQMGPYHRFGHPVGWPQRSHGCWDRHLPVQFTLARMVRTWQFILHWKWELKWCDIKLVVYAQLNLNTVLEWHGSVKQVVSIAAPAEWRGRPPWRTRESLGINEPMCQLDAVYLFF